jgi:hypothetical protein
MGYPADLNRARGWYKELAEIDEPTRYESTLGLDADYYNGRIGSPSAT